MITALLNDLQAELERVEAVLTQRRMAAELDSLVNHVYPLVAELRRPPAGWTEEALNHVKDVHEKAREMAGMLSEMPQQPDDLMTKIMLPFTLPKLLFPFLAGCLQYLLMAKALLLKKHFAKLIGPRPPWPAEIADRKFWPPEITVEGIESPEEPGGYARGRKIIPIKYNFDTPFRAVRKPAHFWEREITAYQRFDHPNIPELLEVYRGEDFPTPVTVCVRKPGKSLDSVLLEKVIPIPRHWKDLDFALACMLQICDAVSHCHERGIVNRDIKPGNILVTLATDPAAWLVDFEYALPEAGDREKVKDIADLAAVLEMWIVECYGYADQNVDDAIEAAKAGQYTDCRQFAADLAGEKIPA